MNWYIIYTKPKSEKKVSVLLTKRKIKNFVPLNCKQTMRSRKNKMHYEPLFSSYVFVKIEECDISLLSKVEGIVNVVYWKGKPAIVKGGGNTGYP